MSIFKYASMCLIVVHLLNDNILISNQALLFCVVVYYAWLKINYELMNHYYFVFLTNKKKNQ